MLGKIPLYQQLIEELVKYISDEKLLPGDQIITEPEISRKYGVSRATVRQAIQELVNAGVLVKLHGKGTFIAEPKVKMNVTTFGSFSTMAKEQGFHPSTKILCFQEIMEPTDKVRKRLLLGAGESVIYLNRLRYLDGNPALIEKTYLPQRLFPHFDLLKVEKSGLYNFFKECGIESLKGSERFTACIPTEEEKKALEILDSDPCIRVRRIMNDTEMPVEYTVCIFKNKTLQFESEIEVK